VKHRLFNTLSVLSSVLFVATAILWVRSYWQSDFIQVLTAPTCFIFGTIRGEVGVAVALHEPVDKVSSPKFLWETGRPYSLRELADEMTVTQAGGFAILHQPLLLTSLWGIALPCWFVMGITALPAISLVCKRSRNAFRKRRNICLKCGYDLRATPNRCPECGAIPTGSKVTT